MSCNIDCPNCHGSGRVVVPSSTNLYPPSTEIHTEECPQMQEHRKALAMAMVEPIRRMLEYQAIGRKLLLVDEVPPNIDIQHESS